MSDITFRQADTHGDTGSTTSPSEAKVEPTVSGEKKIEPPFTSYEIENKQPYFVKYFDLGDKWNDPDGGFGTEIGSIESYFKDQVLKGKMEDSLDAVRSKLASIEAQIGIDLSERKVMRIGKIASFIKFLKETDDINLMNKKYGGK